jgi:nucleotide-binding universal stress UspA family protein
MNTAPRSAEVISLSSLVTTNGETMSIQVSRRAFLGAAARRIHTLHVVLGPSTDIPAGPRYVSPSLRADVAGRLRNAAISHEIYTESTDPAHRVIALAEERHADLVVIGLQRRSATMKLFIGSHARDILVDAPCPVVAVRE